MRRTAENEEERGSLYLIESIDQKAVKLGFARSVAGRMAMLQTGNPSRLALRDEVPCTLSAEKALHRMLRPLRIEREWYPDSIFFDMLVDEFGSWAGADEYITEADVRKLVPLVFRWFAFDGEDDGDEEAWRSENDERVTKIIIDILPVSQRCRPPETEDAYR